MVNTFIALDEVEFVITLTFGTFIYVQLSYNESFNSIGSNPWTLETKKNKITNYIKLKQKV